jgi:predicted flap endonuclease-1-like 5' DNA nuclease
MPMWDVFFKRWFELVFWWLPKNQKAPARKAESTPPQRTKAARPAAPSARAASQTPAKRDIPGAARAGGRPAANGGAPRAPEPSVRPPAKPAVAQADKAVTPPIPDDLTVIKGIGPAVQNKLRALGITTFADLAAANPDKLMEQLKGSQPLSRGRVHHWTQAARERART